MVINAVEKISCFRKYVLFRNDEISETEKATERNILLTIWKILREKMNRGVHGNE